jgi:hypothetical protein
LHTCDATSSAERYYSLVARNKRIQTIDLISGQVFVTVGVRK